MSKKTKALRKEIDTLRQEVAELRALITGKPADAPDLKPAKKARKAAKLKARAKGAGVAIKSARPATHKSTHLAPRKLALPAATAPPADNGDE